MGFAPGDLPRRRHPSFAASIFYRFGTLTLRVHGYLQASHNGSERAARGPVLGRKNHYGSKSLRGTQVAATFYSLVESAKLCQLEPRFYLRVAVRAGLRGEPVPLPHEVAHEVADGTLDPAAFDDGTEQLVATVLAATTGAVDPAQ